MNQNYGIASKIWFIVYPAGMYYAAITVGSFAAQIVFGAGIESYMLCKTVGSLTAIPVVWSFYKQDLIFEGTYGLKMDFDAKLWKNVVLIAGISACMSIALNNIISMSPLVTVSEAYKEASAAFYGSTIGMELLGSALITPILEELLHRGVVYKRLRNMVGIKAAVIISALIFAGLHFNVVQFIYAFLLGLVLAVFMEKTNRLYAPVLAHVAANTIAVIRTETGMLSQTVDGSLSAWLVSAALLLLGTGGFLAFIKQKEVRAKTY
uniref:CPBP family intramembrane glutamic endopeptidase n=1 Tax=Agathobacter sp. TaxID=2021311 RepID=UPI004055EEED